MIVNLPPPHKQPQALVKGPGESKDVSLSFISFNSSVTKRDMWTVHFQDSFQFHIQCSLLILWILLEMGQNLEIWILKNTFGLFRRKNVVMSIEKACLME